ncbi:MAG: BamA/TamA family outer membrane protein [Oligoflexia bacterium]|nr:BamA/TamA family outer membrane protein [Oligoflexia bacterium]
MKNICYFFILILIFAFTFLQERLRAEVTESAAKINVDHVVISCSGIKNCEVQIEKIGDLKGIYPSLDHLRERVRFILFESRITRFHYSLNKNIEMGQNILYLNFYVHPFINEIKINSKYSEIDIAQLKNLLPLKEGDFFYEGRIARCEQVIVSYLKERGFWDAAVEFKKNFDGDNVSLVFNMSDTTPTILNQIDVDVKEDRIRRIIWDQIRNFRNRPFDYSNLKNKLDDINRSFQERGNYFSNIEILHIQKNYDAAKGVVAKVKVDIGERYVYTFSGNKVFSNQELQQIVRDVAKKDLNNLNFGTITDAVNLAYEEKGLYNTKIEIAVERRKIPGEGLWLFHIVKIKEGHKIKIKDLQFFENSKFSTEEITEFYYSRGTPVAKGNYYDKNYLQRFSNLLTQRYVENGMVFAKVFGPMLSFSENLRTISVSYKVREDVQVIINKITISGITSDLQDEISKEMANQEGRPLNTIALEDDLRKAEEILKGHGYFYAKGKNFDQGDVVTYRSDYREATLFIDVDAGEKIYLSGLVITGLQKTKGEVIHRDIDIKEGDLITPEEIDKIQNNLRGLGIFSQSKVQVIPSEFEKNKASILISVREKDFGVVEVAPGYRTDLGMKLSLEWSRNNIDGLNKSLSFKGQVNQRTDFNSFDPRRRQAKKKKVEYSTRLGHTWPYFLSWPLTMQSQLSNSQRRYYSFDVNVLKANISLSKLFFQRVTLSTAYQLESIKRVDATDLDDNGHFRIGAVIPSVSLDLRDSNITPSKGAFLLLSYELAKPAFYSQKKENYEINYYKLTSRNRFYFPIKKQELILAVSVSGGVEKDLVEQYSKRKVGIPRDKVFRLNGIDTVRGFRDYEINRLSSGEDIYEVDVYNTAYFVNVKIEPRILISENLMLGVFYDAGRVFVTSMDLTRLRNSVGLGIKYLTPVGSLDLDYGIKLWRRQLPNGTLERPGEFHISIGFF